MELADYARALNNIKKLSPAEESELWSDYKQAGDNKARSSIIEAYQPLVFREALAFRESPLIMDIVQEGTIGLIEAVENYEPERGVAFSLYAVHRIRGRMLNLLEREGKVDMPYLDAPINIDSGESRKNLICATAPTTEELAEHSELWGRVSLTMNRLPPKEKAVLEGVYLGNATIAMLAESLNISTGHVYRLRDKAIRRTRGMLSRFMSQWK